MFHQLYFTAAQPYTSSAAVVNSSTALALPALDRGLSLIANSLTRMAPMQLWDDGEKVGTTPFLQRPSPLWTSSEFWSSATKTLVLFGNWVALKQRDGGEIVGLIPAPIEQVAMIPGSGASFVYEISGKRYSPEQVVHVRWDMLAGSLRGVGVLEKHRRALGLAMDVDQYSATSYRGGNVPSAIVKVDPDLDDSVIQRTKEAWDEANADGKRTLRVVPRDSEFVPLVGFSPQDMETLAARVMSVVEIAHMLSLDPSDLGVVPPTGGSDTYKNMQERYVQRAYESVFPVAQRFEEAFSDLLPGQLECRFQREKLIGLDEQGQASVDAQLISAGIKTVDEVRAERGLPPRPKPEIAPAPEAATPPQDPTS